MFLEKIAPDLTSCELLGLPKSEIRADIDQIYRMFELERTIRFFGQYHWEAETIESEVKPGQLALENVAAHTFQVASSVQLLAPHFQNLTRAKAIELALLHDQLEIYTGDKDPVGEDGQGLDTHAFNQTKRTQKLSEEQAALRQITSSMRASMRAPYRALMEEVLYEKTVEAHFVKAVDKLQALAFVRLKKDGKFTPEHIAFTIRYSRLGVESFPELHNHFLMIFSDLMGDISKNNQTNMPSFCVAVNRILAGDGSVANRSSKRIALIGKSGSGKSTVASLLQLYCGTTRISTGAVCRRISMQLFGNEFKSSTQSIDDALTQIDPSVFLNAALLNVGDDCSICIDSLRFQSDLVLARERKLITIRIVAPDELRFSRLERRGQVFDPRTDGIHRSETELDEAEVDFTIENMGDIAALERAVHAICLTHP